MSFANPINPDGKEIRVAVRVTAETKQRIIKYCQRHNTSGSAFLRKLIKRELDEEDRRVKNSGRNANKRVRNEVRGLRLERA